MIDDQKTLSRDKDKYIVRFKDGMREEIKRRAADNGRSMNAEIIHLLRRGMEASHVPG